MLVLHNNGEISDIKSKIEEAVPAYRTMLIVCLVITGEISVTNSLTS